MNSATRSLAEHLASGTLVPYETTLPVGTTRARWKPTVEALGLPQDGPLALVSLGAGNINHTSGDVGAAAAALASLGVGVCVTVPEIAAAGGRAGGDVHMVRDYPLSRRYWAFDVVISASGSAPYTSCSGSGALALRPEHRDVPRRPGEPCPVHRGPRLVAHCANARAGSPASRPPWSGAFVPTRRPGGRVAGRVRESRTAREVVSRIFDLDVTVGGAVFFSAGKLLGGQGLDNLPVVLVSLVGTADDDVPEVLEWVAKEQVLTGGFRLVVVLGSDHFANGRQYDWPVGFVVLEHSRADAEVAWREYLRDRVRSMRRGYGAGAVVELASADAPGT